MTFGATFLMALKVFIATSIFFVWVNHYQKITNEFKEFNLPDWVRNLTGIMKLSFALMLLISENNLTLQFIGALGISVLMACAQGVHMTNKTSLVRRLPSLILLLLALALGFIISSQ